MIFFGGRARHRYRLNVPITAILWAAVFRKQFSRWQVLSFVLVMASCFIVRFDVKMHISWNPWILIIVLQVFLSSLAGVVNEFSFKAKALSSMGLNLQVVCAGRRASNGHGKRLVFCTSIRVRSAVPVRFAAARTDA